MIIYHTFSRWKKQWKGMFTLPLLWLHPLSIAACKKKKKERNENQSNLSIAASELVIKFIFIHIEMSKYIYHHHFQLLLKIFSTWLLCKILVLNKFLLLKKKKERKKYNALHLFFFFYFEKKSYEFLLFWKKFANILKNLEFSCVSENRKM